MSRIKRDKIEAIGYGFVPAEFLSAGETEYDARFLQNPKKHYYRNLSEDEIAKLEKNNNHSSNWKDVFVTNKFHPELIENSKFYGLIHIGDMDAIYLEYRDLKLTSGIYNSQIISSDIGDYVAIHNVRYLSHFIIGNEVMLMNINEMETSNSAKFGNGMVKVGEIEERRVQLELRNENGGRKIVPFDGMQAADAYLWTQYIGDHELQQRFLDITENEFSKKRGFYSTIGDRCVIKNSGILKDVKIGDDAYIKGVNKIKNVTVNSTEKAYTQIGEGCELVNGIIGYGCRVFYGVKAVRFFLSSFSQLKYGARLINSFLGDNSTISCCEVLNSLIFPAHEQHHNNSFLCASMIKGQSNMAAGATVGSNHNSRAADGEIVAGRGFWPGLCVSLKHNSRFASYTLIVKGDFLHELDVRIPFSLVSLDVANDELIVVPGYWFLYNMYALMRNTNKFLSRDKRQLKHQYLEYEILAPDTVNELFSSLTEIEVAVGRSFHPNELNQEILKVHGKQILDSNTSLVGQEILLLDTEFSKRKVKLIKVREGYSILKQMIIYYSSVQIIDYLKTHSYAELQILIENIKYQKRSVFENVGSQLIRKNDLKNLLDRIKSKEINSWKFVHKTYHYLSEAYPIHKLEHAIISLQEISEVPYTNWNQDFLHTIFDDCESTKEWILSEIYKSREKDYVNPFKAMVYESYEEMEIVIGKLEDNAFINQQRQELEDFKRDLQIIKEKLI
ncbi:DUF4954 family protein [Sphingobacterium hungaricum]